MVLVGVFDHSHLELARQADDCGNRQAECGQPAGVEGVFRIDDDAIGGSLGKDALETASDMDHENPDREQSRELDHGLEGDGGDDAMVLLLGVNMTRAEQDGKQRHAGGNTEGQAHIVDTLEAALAEFGGPGDRLDRRGDSFQLQGDIGRDADHCDTGDQHRESV